jgi:hypothetical protein
MKRSGWLVGAILIAELILPMSWAGAVATATYRPADTRPWSTVAGWTPWDGNKITSAGNCLSRLGYIATTYGVQPSQLKCARFPRYTCPESYYWMVMVVPGANVIPRPTPHHVAHSTPAC